MRHKGNNEGTKREEERGRERKGEEIERKIEE